MKSNDHVFALKSEIKSHIKYSFISVASSTFLLGLMDVNKIVSVLYFTKNTNVHTSETVAGSTYGILQLFSSTIVVSIDFFFLSEISWQCVSSLTKHAHS